MKSHLYKNRQSRKEKKELDQQITNPELNKNILNSNSIDNMPLLDFTYANFKTNNYFDNYYIIIHLHILKDLEETLIFLVKQKITPSKTLIIGKPYSTNMNIVENLIKKGFKVFPESYLMSEKKPLDEALITNTNNEIEHYLRLIKDNQEQKLMVIDDGGLIINQINLKLKRPCFSEIKNKISAVELTSRGYAYLNKTTLEIPVINIARSWGKLNIEPNLIAASVMPEIYYHCNLLKSYNSFKSCLIIGCGYIGSSIGRQLENKILEVNYYDIDNKKASKDTNTINELEDKISHYDLIIGCTGQSAIPKHLFKLLKNNTLLISTSSSDNEFHGSWLRQKYDYKSWQETHTDSEGFDYGRDIGHPLIFLGSRCDPSHYLYRIKLGNNTIFLANGGCPINFTGNITAMPTQNSQFTMSLILLAALESTQNQSVAGWVDLNIEKQQLISRKFDGMTKHSSME